MKNAKETSHQINLSCHFSIDILWIKPKSMKKGLFDTLVPVDVDSLVNLIFFSSSKNTPSANCYPQKHMMFGLRLHDFKVFPPI